MRRMSPLPTSREAGRTASDISASLIEKALEGYTGTLGRRVLVFSSVDSTNTTAQDLAKRGFPEGTVVIADSQVRGRGRHGRRWFSPPRRNLYMSILLRPPLAAREAFMLTLMSATSCCRAVRDCTALPVSIKWPNDIVCNERKLGGILIETKPEGDGMRHAVVGIGLNVNTEEADLVDEIKETATSLRIETGATWERNDISASLIRTLDRHYRDLCEKGAGYIREEWLKLASTIGRAVRVTAHGAVVKGVAVDIDESGSLVLTTSDGTLTKVSAGELTHLRPGDLTT
jgi:BirA family biotin operon repressor/biotin-[acetyl-CoA-carboxylase] ligase